MHLPKVKDLCLGMLARPTNKLSYQDFTGDDVSEIRGELADLWEVTTSALVEMIELIAAAEQRLTKKYMNNDRLNAMEKEL